MSRLYGKKENINSKKVMDFFNDRASNEVENILSIPLLQEKENAVNRHEEEEKILFSNIHLKNKKVLEIGCGLGRLVEALHDVCSEYLGIDYSKNLINLAKEIFDYDNCYFQEMSCTDIDIDNLFIKPPFDVIIISGVLMYINDNDLISMIDEINKITNKDTVMFIMEPISYLDERLTLKDFYSDELESDYNAIYRTEKEYMDIFGKLNHINEIVSDVIFQDLNKRQETGYKYFIISLIK